MALMNYEAMPVLCDQLKNQYDKMARRLEAFSETVDSYSKTMDGRIIRAVQEVLENMNADMRSINSYITKFTQSKHDSAVEMGQIDKEYESEVFSIGG